MMNVGRHLAVRVGDISKYGGGYSVRGGHIKVAVADIKYGGWIP